MGADGHILIVSKTKAIELFHDDWDKILEEAPGCKYERNIFSNEVVTFYWGDNIFSSIWNENDWMEYSKNKLETKRLYDLFNSNIDKIKIDTWEVWT